MIELRKLPDGRIQARRLDGKPLTHEDREEARRIAHAKAEGRDVRNNTHLQMLKQQATEVDVLVPVEAWYPVFHDLHLKVVAESPDFDYRWAREHRAELYAELKAAERRIDSLQDTLLSEVIALVREWRELLLKAHFAQREFLARACEWYTPPEIVEAARRVMGEIDLDPASNTFAQEVVKAKQFFTEQTDGLRQPWSGNVWLNPPYSAPGKFVDKLVNAFDSREVSEAVVLVNNATDAAWFHQLARRFPMCLLRGRVKFWNPIKNGNSPRQGQVVFFLGPNAEKFSTEFSKFGCVKQPHGGLQ